MPADVGPRAEQEGVTALAVGQGVLEQRDREADDRDTAIGRVGLGAAQAEDALFKVDVAAAGAVRLAQARDRLVDILSIGLFSASPQASEPRVNKVTAHRKTCFVPKRSAIQPLIGMNTASATM